MFEAVNQHLASLAFPPHCLQCRTSLPVQSKLQWCSDCLSELAGKEQFGCRRCGARLTVPSPWENRCVVCYSVSTRFDRAYSIGNYQSLLQQLVRRMKREKSEAIATQFGTALSHGIMDSELDQRALSVVAIPTHWWKQLRRGFHAAAIIANAVSRSLHCRYLSNGLCSQRLTRKQGTLSTSARIRNVKGAFRVPRPSAVRGQHILLVDDVMTSCATANEAARILKQAGATQVTLGVVARGVRAT